MGSESSFSHLSPMSPLSVEAIPTRPREATAEVGFGMLCLRRFDRRLSEESSRMNSSLPMRKSWYRPSSHGCRENHHRQGTSVSN